MASPFESSRVWFSEPFLHHFCGSRLANTLCVTVTGSSQGLGNALLNAILEAGERAVATLRNPAALAGLQSRYPASQLLVVPLDVTSAFQINDAFEAAKKHFSRLDVVVNNAGYGLLCEIEGTSDEEARKIMEVLFWGPVNITKQVSSASLSILGLDLTWKPGYQVFQRG